MKAVLILFSGIGIVAAVTFVIVSQKKEADFNKERQVLKSGWEAERAELEAALQSAKNKAAQANRKRIHRLPAASQHVIRADRQHDAEEEAVG